MGHLFTKIHPSLGIINYRQSLVAKHISIKMSSSKGVTLVIPKRASMKAAELFLEQNVGLIQERMVRIREKNPMEVFGPQSTFKTHSHELVLLASNVISPLRFAVQVNATQLRIEFHSSMDWSQTWVQEGMRKAIEETYRLEAKVYLPPRVRMLADRFGFKYESLRVRNTRSRWGSCSSRNTLSFSLHLMSLPDHLIDLVILHELCHTIHRNHGVQFHALLQQVCPDKKKWENELRLHVL